MPLGMEVGLGPGHIVLDVDTAFPQKWGRAPNFRSMSIVDKRSPISAAAEHLLKYVFVLILDVLVVTTGVRLYNILI